MSHPRSRMAAVAGSLALSLSLVTAPAALGQDDPGATVEGLLAAIEAKDFEAIPGFFCDEFASQAEAFDLSTMAEGLPPGVDPAGLLDAIILDAEVASTEVVSQTETEAVVMVEGSLSMGIDLEALTPFIESLLEASGMDVTPDMVDQFSTMMGAQFETETLEISEEVTLVPGEAMAWVVCDELGAAAMDDEMAEEPTDEAAAEDPMDEEPAEAEVTEGE